MDFQKLINVMSDASLRERSKYQATLGDLIDKLKMADDSLEITPKIVGISAYRGYYSDIALCTESSGLTAFKTPYDYEDTSINYNKWSEENTINLDLPKTPKEMGTLLESVVGFYFDGYKGGYNEITRDKPLWVATDYGNCSGIVVMEITDKLELITKKID